MATDFEKIYRGLSTEVGRFRVAAGGMAWRSEQQKDNVVSLPAAEIKWAQWLRVARKFQLRVGLKDRSRETFDGFKREEQDKLAATLKSHLGITLEPQEVSFKGWNWGITDFRGDDLAFLVSNKTSFELPLQRVANSNIAGRTEVSLEFTGDRKSAKSGPDEMVEIRFFVPGQTTKPRASGSDAGSDKSVAENDEEEISAAQAFHDSIKEKAELGQVSGNMILSFEDVLVLTPRGRYDVDMFPDFLRLRGKTYDYKILYSSISRLFLLPKDDLHVLFILGLSTPIRQGQTRYQYLVMQFTREEETTAELNMSDEAIAEHDRLKKNYEDPTFEVVSSVFRALSKKKITGAGNYQSRNGHPGIKGNLKAVQGDLFLLDRCIFFVSKQPVLVDLSDVHQVIFSRVGSAMGAAGARTFDMNIVTKSGPEYTFTSINKEEYDGVDAYLKEKRVRVKNEMVPDADIMLAAEDSDEEMQSVASDEDEAPRVRRTGDDDEDSEEDADFQASSSDGGSPSESESDSDEAATASDASGDRPAKKSKGKAPATAKDPSKKAPAKKKKADVDADKPKKKKVDADADKPKNADADVDKPKKAAPKPKKGSDDDDNAMVVDSEPEEKPKPKPKPKAKAAPKPKVKEGGEGEPAKKKQKKSAD